MKVAYGLKVHSGWAALVVLGRSDGELVVVDRRRVELVDEEWASRTPGARPIKENTALGKLAGPPWGKDQKDAALAALLALRF